MLENVNIWAVLVSAIVTMVIGMVWYSKPVFGKTWMKLSGKTAKDMKKAQKEGCTKKMIAAFIATLITAVILDQVLGLMNAVTIANGLYVSFFAWLGFVAPMMLGIVLWDGKPCKLYVLNVAYWLVVLLVMGAILAAW